MKDSKELWLCSLPMKKGILDDDYRFFDDVLIPGDSRPPIPVILGHLS